MDPWIFLFLDLLIKLATFKYMSKKMLWLLHCNAMLGLPVDNRFKQFNQIMALQLGTGRFQTALYLPTSHESPSLNLLVPPSLSLSPSRPSLPFVLPLVGVQCWCRNGTLWYRPRSQIVYAGLNTHFGFKSWTSSRFLNLALKNCTSNVLVLKFWTLSRIPNPIKQLSVCVPKSAG